MGRISNSHRRSSSRRRAPTGTGCRRGASLIELTVAAMVMGTVFALLGPVMTSIREQRRLAGERQLAVAELANCAERQALKSWTELTADGLADLELSAAAGRTLLDAQLNVTVAEESDPVARRVTFELTWQDRGGRTVQPLQLVVWRFPIEEGRP